MAKLAKILLKFILLTLTSVIIVGVVMLALRDQTMIGVSVTYLVEGGGFDQEQSLDVSFANGTEYIVRAPMALKVEENYSKGVTEVEVGTPIMKVNQALTEEDFYVQGEVEKISREVSIKNAENQLTKYRLNLSAEEMLLTQKYEAYQSAQELISINGMSQANFNQVKDAYDAQVKTVNELIHIIDAEKNAVDHLRDTYREMDIEEAIEDEKFTFSRDNTAFATDEEGTFLGKERVVITYSNDKEFVNQGEILFKYVVNAYTDDVILQVNGPNESIPNISEDNIWEIFPVGASKMWFFQYKEDVYDHGKRYLKGKLVVPPKVEPYKDIKVVSKWGYPEASKVKKSAMTIADTVLQPKISKYEVAQFTLPKSCFISLTGIKPGSVAKIFVVSNETTAFGEEAILREVEVQITHTSDLHVGFSLVPNQRNAYALYRQDTAIVQSPTEEFFDGLAVEVLDHDYN